MSKAKLTTKEVEHIANLSQLTLTKTELKKFAQEMVNTLDYIHNLNHFKTDQVVPTHQTTGLKNRFSQEPTNNRTLSNNQALQNARKKKNGFFQIKGFSYLK